MYPKLLTAFLDIASTQGLLLKTGFTREKLRSGHYNHASVSSASIKRRVFSIIFFTPITRGIYAVFLKSVASQRLICLGEINLKWLVGNFIKGAFII